MNGFRSQEPCQAGQRRSAQNERLCNRSLFAHVNPLSYVPSEWKEGVRQFWNDTKESVFDPPEKNGVAIDNTVEKSLIDDLEQARRNRVINHRLLSCDFFV